MGTRRLHLPTVAGPATSRARIERLLERDVPGGNVLIRSCGPDRRFALMTRDLAGSTVMTGYADEDDLATAACAVVNSPVAVLAAYDLDLERRFGLSLRCEAKLAGVTLKVNELDKDTLSRRAIRAILNLGAYLNGHRIHDATREPKRYALLELADYEVDPIASYFDEAEAAAQGAAQTLFRPHALAGVWDLTQDPPRAVPLRGRLTLERPVNFETTIDL